MALRILLLTGWLLLPLGAWAYHAGPGQSNKALDVVAEHLRAAEKAVAEESFGLAIEEYDEALRALPTDRVAEARKIRLEKAKAQMLDAKLPEAHADLRSLVDELAADPKADPNVLAEARAAQANSQYYATWLMRLEGLGRDDWDPEIEASRQTYKLLAEDAEKRGDTAAATKYREDLEASIRLARMELNELQGLALPKQCRCCCSCKSRKPKTGKKDKVDTRGAGASPPIDDGGH